MTSRSCLLAAAILLWPTLASAGALGDLKLAQRAMPLLGGRLTLRMPDKANDQPRPWNIMSAPKPPEEETRILLDASKERLVVFTYESFASADTDFAKNVPSHFMKNGEGKIDDYTFEPVRLAKPLLGVAVTPKHPDPTREAVLVHGVYVRSADQTIQVVLFFVNPEGAKDLAGATQLARRIAATIAPGTRTVDLKAGPRRLGELMIDVPDGVLATTQLGPDFHVYQLCLVVPLGKRVPSLRVYVGGHPSSLRSDQQGVTPKVTTTRGKLLGEDVSWETWTHDGRTTREAIAPLPGTNRGFAHVFMSAESASEIDRLFTIAETLRTAKH